MAGQPSTAHPATLTSPPDPPHHAPSEPAPPNFHQLRDTTFCNFGDHTGTVEAIGIRSTQLRALDRTQITIPNAQFADMQIVNWAKCDQMLINETIGLRYETSPDQLRFVLAKLREMVHAHPRIDNDTVRVRFSGYGNSALNVTLRNLRADPRMERLPRDPRGYLHADLRFGDRGRHRLRVPVAHDLCRPR